MTLIYFLMRMKKGNVMLQKIKQKVQILFLQCRRFPLLVKYKLEYRQSQCYSLLVWPEVQMNVILRGIVKQLKLFHFLSSRQKSLYSCAITPLKQVRGKNCLLKGYSMKKTAALKFSFCGQVPFVFTRRIGNEFIFMSLEPFTLPIFLFLML